MASFVLELWIYYTYDDVAPTNKQRYRVKTSKLLFRCEIWLKKFITDDFSKKIIKPITFVIKYK